MVRLYLFQFCSVQLACLTCGGCPIMSTKISLRIQTFKQDIGEISPLPHRDTFKTVLTQIRLLPWEKSDQG